MEGIFDLIQLGDGLVAAFSTLAFAIEGPAGVIISAGLGLRGGWRR